MAAALPAAGTAPITTFPGVCKGRELTRKDRRLDTSLEPLNTLLEGGIPRGRISEIIGRRSCGKTSLAAAFISSATRRGEIAAVIDLAGAFDPATMGEAGVELSKVLWVQPGGVMAPSQGSRFFRWSGACPESGSEKFKGMLEEYVNPHPNPLPGQGEGTERVLPQAIEGARAQTDVSFPRRRRTALSGIARDFLRAAELVLEAGGFGLLIMDFDESAFTLASSSALRLARMAERSGTAVLMLAARPLCGTFAALSLDLIPMRILFSRQALSTSSRKIAWPEADSNLSRHFKNNGRFHPAPHSRFNVGNGTGSVPVLFEGLEIKAAIRRNKIGRSGQSTQWCSLINISDPTSSHSAPKAMRIA